MTKASSFILTKRERDTLALAGKGLANQDIAKELGISIPTVKSTLHRACIRLGARNRSQAVILAIKHKAMGIQELLSLEELIDLLATLGPEAIDIAVQSLQSRRRQGNFTSDTGDLSQLKK
jgi:DNA-binding CsgD family transcriptional regulator